MKVKPWAAALAAAVLITGVWMAGVSREADGLSDKLIRLHVVANSDSGTIRPSNSGCGTPSLRS